MKRFIRFITCRPRHQHRLFISVFAATFICLVHIYQLSLEPESGNQESVSIIEYECKYNMNCNTQADIICFCININFAFYNISFACITVLHNFELIDKSKIQNAAFWIFVENPPIGNGNKCFFFVL